MPPYYNLWRFPLIWIQFRALHCLQLLCLISLLYPEELYKLFVFHSHDIFEVQACCSVEVEAFIVIFLVVVASLPLHQPSALVKLASSPPFPIQEDSRYLSLLPLLHQ